MISFENDYSTGAHPRILEALAATNLEPAPLLRKGGGPHPRGLR